jgi:hypothetical protein
MCIMHEENVFRFARVDLLHLLHEVFFGAYYLVGVIALPV